MKKLSALILALTVAFAAGACKNDASVIIVGASASPHAEILEIVKDDLKAQGFTLKIKIFDDYVVPNTAVESGELTANYFQHLPYLEEFNQTRGTHIVSVGTIHYEAFAIYSKKIDAISDVDAATTAVIPNDPTNGARALMLLQEAGLIKLKSGGSITSTKEDVIDDLSLIKKNNIKPLEAKLISQALDDATITVINGNYALSGEVPKDYVLFKEGVSLGAELYANALCVKEGNENLPSVQALIKALKSDEVKNFIEEHYDGFVGVVF